MSADLQSRIELSDEERELLIRGLGEWGGPARCTEALAVAMDFGSVGDLISNVARISRALADREPLPRSDWRRALFATEIAFASDVVGSGVEWATTTGLSDESTVRVLRGLQRKIAGRI